MICPLLELADPRCAAHFNLTNLSDAFTHCVGRYQACPVYQRLLRDRACAIANPPPMAIAAPPSGRLAG